jgi:hypothetical protein
VKYKGSWNLLVNSRMCQGVQRLNFQIKIAAWHSAKPEANPQRDTTEGTISLLPTSKQSARSLLSSWFCVCPRVFRV